MSEPSDEQIKAMFFEYCRTDFAKRILFGAPLVRLDIGHIQNAVQGKGLTLSHSRCWDIAWRLVNDGLIAPGSNAAVARYGYTPDGPEWRFPSFHFTEFGIAFLQQVSDGSPSPIEPVRYESTIRERFTNLGYEGIAYIREAIQTYNRGFNLAPTVLVGVAAEEIATILYDAFAEHLPKSEAEAYAQARRKKSGSAEYQFEEFRKRFDRHKSEMPDALKIRADDYLLLYVRLLKVSRDDVAHGREMWVDKDVAFARLASFPDLLNIVEKMIGFFRANECSLG